MPDIFLSYAREDRPKAQEITAGLKAKGWSTWSDMEIKVGDFWAKAIDQQLRATRCVLVLVSKHSVRSEMIANEISLARVNSTVIPVLLDDVPLPLSLARIQAANLIGWNGSPSSPAFQELVDAIKAALSGAIEIVRRPSQVGVKEYLRSLKQDQYALGEVKVLFVGDGSAGKTSLIKRLTGRAFDKSESQTHGINIEKGLVKNGDQEIKLNLWDFGGQEIMHSTHQFFLSKRSLYVLVLDGRKEEDAEYWLQLTGTFGGASPVLIALNKIDENPSFDVNRKFLLDKYFSITGFNRISCRTGEGIEVFAARLRDTVTQIGHLRTMWPLPWFRVKSHLESMTEDYIISAMIAMKVYVVMKV